MTGTNFPYLVHRKKQFGVIKVCYASYRIVKFTPSGYYRVGTIQLTGADLRACRLALAECDRRAAES